MTRSPTLFAALYAIAAALPMTTASAADLAVNFHPAGGVWPHPLESARNLNGVLLQNIAVVNRGSEPVTVRAIDIASLRDGEATTTVHLNASRLDAIAERSGVLAQSGMLQAFDFQFSPDTLFEKDARVSAERTLAPGGALHLMHQFLAYNGAADRVRITVHLADASVRTAEIPIHSQQTTVRFRFPLRGRWYIGAGATTHSHHRWVAAEEFALDILRIGEGGKTHRGNGERMRDYYAYGAPVLASADGEVVIAHDGRADNIAMLRRPQESLVDFQQRLLAGQGELLSAGIDAISGNHVVIRHANGMHSVYAHLRPGSVNVAVGDRVKAGDVIAALGGSGNSTEPHLHFHVCDGPATLHCAGVPVVFEDVDIPLSDSPRPLQTGDLLETR